MKMRVSLILIILAIIIGAAHATMQFILWANVAGTNLSSDSNSLTAWAVVSFPLFTVLPRDVATRFFGLFLVPIVYFGLGASSVWVELSVQNCRGCPLEDGDTVVFKYGPFCGQIYKSSSGGTSVFAYD